LRSFGQNNSPALLAQGAPLCAREAFEGQLTLSSIGRENFESYIEFKGMCWVGHFPTGLRWVDAFRGTGVLDECVREAQGYIRDRYSPQAIGQKWASFLESV
jgi:hypothetical protein